MTHPSHSRKLLDLIRTFIMMLMESDGTEWGNVTIHTSNAEKVILNKIDDQFDTRTINSYPANVKVRPVTE